MLFLRDALAKASAWSYESEYRLIAQESANAVDADTLKTDNHVLSLPEGALRSVIVGCQGPQEAVKELVAELAPGIRVKRAVRIPNRYELYIAIGE